MRLMIVEDRETVDLSPRGDLIRIRHIEYMLDDKGPFVYEVPTALWKIEEFKAAVEKRAAEIRELEGAEF